MSFFFFFITEDICRIILSLVFLCHYCYDNKHFSSFIKKELLMQVTLYKWEFIVKLQFIRLLGRYELLAPRQSWNFEIWTVENPRTHGGKARSRMNVIKTSEQHWGFFRRNFFPSSPYSPPIPFPLFPSSLHPVLSSFHHSFLRYFGFLQRSKCWGSRKVLCLRSLGHLTSKQIKELQVVNK